MQFFFRSVWNLSVNYLILLAYPNMHYTYVCYQCSARWWVHICEFLLANSFTVNSNGMQYCIKLQGIIFKCTKSLFILWQFQKLQSSTHRILYLEYLGGYQLKRTLCIMILHRSHSSSIYIFLLYCSLLANDVIIVGCPA